LNEVQSEFSFKKIWVVPSKFPPGKTPVASFEKRLAWTRAVFSHDYFEVSTLEASSDQTVFAKEIYCKLQLEDPEAQLTWILGEDQWEQLPFWNRIDEYASELFWLVMGRSEPQQRASGLLSRRLGQSSTAYFWAQNSALPEISSSHIRQLLAEGNETARSFLPPEIQNDVEETYQKQRKEAVR